MSASTGFFDLQNLVPFIYGGLHRGLLGATQRVAVIDAIIHPRGCYDVKSQRSRAYGVLTRYRETLGGLAAAGHLDRARAAWLANCRPAGFRVRPHVRCCNLAAFCPWCWARRAGGYWLRVEQALFSSFPEGERGEAAVDLVLASRWLSRGSMEDYTNERFLAKIIEERLDHRQPTTGPDYVWGSRRLEIERLRNRYQILWGIDGLIFSLAHNRKGELKGFRAGIRQLFAVPAGGAFAAAPRRRSDDAEIMRPRITRIATPSRGRAARAVARLLRYPGGLLGVGESRGDAGALNYYLETVAGRQLWAAYDLPPRPTGGDPDGGAAPEAPNVSGP